MSWEAEYGPDQQLHEDVLEHFARLNGLGMGAKTDAPPFPDGASRWSGFGSDEACFGSHPAYDDTSEGAFGDPELQRRYDPEAYYSWWGPHGCPDLSLTSLIRDFEAE